MTCWPIAFSLTRSMKSRATLKLTSASNNAIRTSRSESATLDSEIFPSPRRFRKTFCSLPLSESNMPPNVRLLQESGKLKVGTQRASSRVISDQPPQARRDRFGYDDGAQASTRPPPRHHFLSVARQFLNSSMTSSREQRSR